ncbi:MAG: TonB-dependent receptor [Tannerella sp.]|jgi:TonB-linked SusC/RagA family outer membrane protein|nr:TonB-dependent receptor [Tannerella sp.]
MEHVMTKFNSTKKRMFFSRVFLVMTFVFCVSAAAFAQNKVISGTIVDTNGEPIIGANVKVKGTSIGNISDIDGNFTFEAPSTGTLVISYIGYKTQEVALGKSIYQITLQDDSEMLDEVVVVGYGTQKKTTLTGAVAQVRGDEVLKGKATTSIAAALQGEIPGLTITRQSSRPGNEGIDITLRGGISVNETDPMIIIDGVEAYKWELSQINPNDVESISVLKDAAAAIYGTKAGAGVIMVTTKRGKEGKTSVTYSGSVHANIIGKRFPVADGQTWGQMLVHATENDAKADNGNYSWWMWPEDVWREIAAGNTYEGVVGGKWRYLDPNSDQFDAVYGNTWGQSHNVSINSGTDKVKVLTSLGYANDRSLVDIVYDGQKKYNFRTNVDYKLNEYVKTEFNVSYDKRNISTPLQGVGHGIQDFYIFPLYNPYGQFYDTFGNNNLVAKLKEGGRKNDTEEILRLGGKITIDLGMLTKGLSITGNANFRLRKHLMIERQTKVTMYDWSGETKTADGNPDYNLGTGSIASETKPDQHFVKNTFEDVMFQTYGGFVNYNREFSGHNIGFMGGITGEKTSYKKMYQFRKGMTVDELDDINLGDATTAEATGGSNEVGMVSILGRLNYDYNGIYLLEGIFRRDGSSKFDKDNRWANFAGISGGIRFSEYDFMKDLEIFDNLKLRGSYGETGSQTGIGNYDYISSIETGTTVFGPNGEKVNTSWIKGMTSSDRTWERVATTNIGLDFGFLQNRLNGSFEYYIRENKGMLISMTYPQTLGGSAPKTNNGNFRANGWELQLNWNDKIGDDFRYRVGFSLADARTKITEYEGAVAINVGLNNKVLLTNDIMAGKAGSYIEGKPLNALYVYKTNGYLQNQADVDAYYQTINGDGTLAPVQGTANQLTPGSVKKVDLNNDGKITTDDLYYYGDANPHYTFGITLGANYKGFDFSMFIQGVGQQYVAREGQLSSPWFSGWTNQNATFWGNTWTESNTNARYPIMSRNGTRNNWNYKWYNDINISNSWYARAKNIVLGYTLPKTIAQKAYLENLRFYVSADNLFEVSNVRDGFDPESKAATGQGNVDVYARTLSFGIDVTF